MKTLRFCYSMRLLFDPPVSQHRFSLRCIPRTTGRQSIRSLRLEVLPNVFLSSETDIFGNSCVRGFAEAPHDCFSVHMEGTARTGLAPDEPAGAEYLTGPFRYQTAHTKPGRAIRSFSEQLRFPDGTTAFARALAYMEALHRTFLYAPGTTSVYTTAEQAMAQGTGVCQDYSHILLSLCRLEGIPCRYVVGLLLGEGASHAWVEVCDRGRWLALDPTNGAVVDDQHIKISAGRDYQDCAINQGVFTGQTRQVQEVRAEVLEMEEES